MQENTRKKKKWTTTQWVLFSLASLGLLYLLVFKYLPMYGIVLAFKSGDYKLNIIDSIFNSEFVGMDNFREFLLDESFGDVMLNTIGLNLLMLLINFPAPIIFALLINELTNRKYMKFVQAVVNLPHFISWAVYAGIILALTDMTTGIMNPLLQSLGILPNDAAVNLQGAEYFWATVIISSLLKGVGWGSIVYLAAIAGVDQGLYEAAFLDGANRFQRAIHITLPSILPTITVFMLLSISGLLGNNFEQFNSLQNAINIEKSEVLATYIYKQGIVQRRYSYTQAMSLFESVISLVLLVTCNAITKKLTGNGIV